MLEWLKLVEICMVRILGFIKDEWFQHPLFYENQSAKSIEHTLKSMCEDV